MTAEDHPGHVPEGPLQPVTLPNPSSNDIEGIVDPERSDQGVRNAIAERAILYGKTLFQMHEADSEVRLTDYSQEHHLQMIKLGERIQGLGETLATIDRQPFDLPDWLTDVLQRFGPKQENNST